MLNHIISTKTFLLVASLAYFLPNKMLAQSDQSKERKWSISVNIAPEVANRSLSSEDSFDNFIISLRNNSEKAMLAYTGGLGVEFKPCKRFSIRSGVQYAVKGHATTMEIWSPPTGPQSTGTVTIRNEYHSIGIPVIASYDFIKKDRLSIFIAAGGSINYLYKQYSRIRQDTDSPLQIDNSSSIPAENQFAGFNIINPSAVVSLGADVKLGERSTLRIEPTFRHSILPLVDASIREYQYNYGLNLGYLFAI